MVKIDIRWSDIDANRHLANTAYINFMSYARTVFMKEGGITHKTMAEHNMGPVVFYEHIYYFREIMPEDPLYISVEMTGMSEEGTFFGFRHNFYDKDGRNMARGEMMGAWIDLTSRKLISLPQSFFDKFKNLKLAEDFKTLTREDTRKYGVFPEDVDASLVNG